MSLYYCPACDYSAQHPGRQTCPKCLTALQENADTLEIPRAELEELVRALEFQLNDPDLAKTEYRFACETAAKFRAKFLTEGK